MAADMVTLPAEEAGQLARFALDMLFMGDQEEGCCPRCCAPCWALQQLLDAGRLDALIAPIAKADGWTDDKIAWWDGRQVRRDFLARAWRMTECHEGGDA